MTRALPKKFTYKFNKIIFKHSVGKVINCTEMIVTKIPP